MERPCRFMPQESIMQQQAIQSSLSILFHQLQLCVNKLFLIDNILFCKQSDVPRNIPPLHFYLVGDLDVLAQGQDPNFKSRLR